MYPWYRDSVAAAAAAGLGGPVGVVGSGFCSTGPGQGATTIKTESGYSDCMLALDYVQSKVSDFTFFFTRAYFGLSFFSEFKIPELSRYLFIVFKAIFYIVRLSVVVWLPISFVEYKDRVQCQHEMKILLPARLMINICWKRET